MDESPIRLYYHEISIIRYYYYLEMKPQISDDDEDNDLRRLATKIKETKILREEHSPVCLYIYIYMCFVGIYPPNINCANDTVNQTKLLEVSSAKARPLGMPTDTDRKQVDFNV